MKAWAFVFLVACGRVSGDVQTEAMVRQADGTYALQDVTLKGVRSLDTLEGERVSFGVGAELNISIDVSRGCSLSGVDCETGTVQELRRGIVGSKLVSLRTRFQKVGTVYRALDYDTLNAVTMYHHVNAAQDFFEGYGVDPTATVGAVPIYYYPDAKSLTRFNLGTSDNAAYFQLVDGFLVLPHLFLQQVPFTINPGVVFHEYSHRIFALRIFGERALLAFLAADDAGFESLMRLRAVSEGVADFFGALATNDPDFVGESAPHILSASRKVDGKHTMQLEWLDASEPTQLGTYDPYQPGSCFASFLWRVKEKLGADATVAAWFTADLAVRDAVQADLGSVTFGFVANAIVAAFPPAQRAEVCDVALEIFAVIEDDFQACP